MTCERGPERDGSCAMEVGAWNVCSVGPVTTVVATVITTAVAAIVVAVVATAVASCYR